LKGLYKGCCKGYLKLGVVASVVKVTIATISTFTTTPTIPTPYNIINQNFISFTSIIIIMSDGYYILEEGEEKGPYTFDELTDMAIGIHDRILSPTVETWQYACDLPELYPYFVAQEIYLPTGDNLASFGWRLLAFIIDYFILSFLLTILISLVPSIGVSFKLQSYNDLLKLPASEMVRLQVIVYVSLLIYNSVCEASAMEGTVGQRICKLVVVDIDGMRLSYLIALLRSAGKVISLFFYGLGFLSIFFTEHRQAMHDFLAKTYVVKRD